MHAGGGDARADALMVYWYAYVRCHQGCWNRSSGPARCARAAARWARPIPGPAVGPGARPLCRGVRKVGSAARRDASLHNVLRQHELAFCVLRFIPNAGVHPPLSNSRTRLPPWPGVARGHAQHPHGGPTPRVVPKPLRRLDYTWGMLV